MRDERRCYDVPNTVPRWRSQDGDIRALEVCQAGIKRQVILPTDAPAFQSEQSTERTSTLPPIKDSALLRAIGLAHYWQMLIDTHKVQSAAEIAAHEEVDITQVRRLMRLTLLSPSRIESIAAKPTHEATLDWILRQSLPNDWCQQDSQFPSRLNKA